MATNRKCLSGQRGQAQAQRRRDPKRRRRCRTHLICRCVAARGSMRRTGGSMRAVALPVAAAGRRVARASRRSGDDPEGSARSAKERSSSMVVGVGGFEPPTLNPQSSGSTTELHPAGREATTRRRTEAAVFGPGPLGVLAQTVQVSEAGCLARRAGNPAKCYPLPPSGAADDMQFPLILLPTLSFLLLQKSRRYKEVGVRRGRSDRGCASQTLRFWDGLVGMREA